MRHSTVSGTAFAPNIYESNTTARPNLVTNAPLTSTAGLTSFGIADTLSAAEKRTLLLFVGKGALSTCPGQRISKAARLPYWASGFPVCAILQPGLGSLAHDRERQSLQIRAGPEEALAPVDILDLDDALCVASDRLD